jgi:exodeoxyribonuclease-3
MSFSINVITWNVNGIRSRVFNSRVSTQLKKNEILIPEKDSSIYNLINETQPDIICLQETRCEKDYGEKFIKIDGYNNFFNSSKLDNHRSGSRYSGTAILTKIIPNNILYKVPEYDDQEGRIIIAEYEKFTLINVYSPNSGTNYDNKIFFQIALLKFINTLNIPIIYCGDFNIAIETHFDITKSKPMPGIFQHELNYYKELVNSNFIDIKSKNDKVIFTWWDQRSKKVINEQTNKETNLMRCKNKGWRIDYIFIKGFYTGESFVLKHIGEEYSPHASDHAPLLGQLFL